MKKPHQVNNARQKIIQRIKTPGLNDLQKALLAGVLNTLVWVADGQASETIERLLSDEPMAPGKDPTAALKTFKKIENL